MTDLIRNEVLTFIQHKECWKCTEGEMVFTGRSLGYTPMFEHTCSKCEYKMSFDQRYPRLSYSPPDDRPKKL